MSKIDITISIVSYNTGDLLSRCLSSIRKFSKGLNLEIIVVDNNSSDDTVKLVKNKFSDVILIENSKNKMFAEANNQALKIAKGKYFLILNPDTYFIDNSLAALISFLEKHTDMGALDGLELYEDGKQVPTGSLFSTPWIDFYELSILGKWVKNFPFLNKKIVRLIDGYRLKGKDRTDIFEIDVACDAFLSTRTEILKKIQGYDEKFKLYYTENDLCVRIKRAGYKVVHFGKAKVIHTVSASVNQVGWKKLDIYYRDLLYFYQKHGYATGGLMLFCLLKAEEMALKIFRSDMLKL